MDNRGAGVLRSYAVTIAASLLLVHGANAVAPTDLVIRATAASFRVGSNGTYSVTVSNVGAAATDTTIHVVDALPAGLTFVVGVGTNWNCTATDQFVDCANDVPLAAGSTSTLRLTVSVCTAAHPAVTNAVTVDYPADTNPGNNTARRVTHVKAGRCIPNTPTPTLGPGTPASTKTATTLPTATPTTTPVPVATDLLLTQNTSSPFRVGGQGLYSISVLNVGPADTATPFTVFDTLPPGLSFAGATGTGWTCSPVGQNVTCTNASPLPVGTKTTIALTVNVGSAAFPSVTNSATLSYPGDTNTTNNTARRPTTIRN